MSTIYEQNEASCKENLRQLCEAAQKLHQSSSSSLQHNFRYYINYYIQHQRLSQDFFICLCEHNILQRLFTASPKYLPAITILELFHLLISNSSKTNDLIYIFSQPIVHEYLFEKFNIYKESSETIEYYVQLLKTITMKASSQENEFLIRLFCNKRFPTFPLLTTVTLLGVSEECDELVKITAQQCVLLLINIINLKKTGLVYLNELQMIVFFYELTRQMLDDEKNTDKEGSIKYFIDLVYTLRDNQTSIYLLFNLLANNLFFRNIKSPEKVIRFLRQFRDQISQYPQLQIKLAESAISILYRIFCKYYFSRYINFTYFCAQQIIPSLTIRQQPKLLKFYAERCKRIDEYLVNEEDYYKSEKGNDCLIDEWLEFNNKGSDSPLRAIKSKGGFAEFIEISDSAVDKYIKDVMVMAGLEVEKLKSPIIKLTYSSNFKTSLFLVESIISKAEEQAPNEREDFIHEQFYKETYWVISPSEELFIEVYRAYLSSQRFNSGSTILIDQAFQGISEFLEQIKPTLARIITEELCKESPNLSKNYLLLLFKLLSKLRLHALLQSQHIQKLLSKLFDMQKLIGELVFNDEKLPSFLKYVTKNQEKAFVREKIDEESLKNGKLKMSPPKEVKLQHYLFYYEVIKRFLDPSLKVLNQFVEEYWQMNFCRKKDNSKTEFKALMACRDADNNYLEVYGTEKFEFQLRYRNKHEELTRFTISDKDCLEDTKKTKTITFEECPHQFRLQSTQSIANFRNDIKFIRQTRKQILRLALLQYMPFIYESIEVKYRNHRYDSSFVTPS